MSETTTPPDIDPVKLEEWRNLDAYDVTPDDSIRHVLRVEGCLTAGDVLDAFDGHHGNPDANPFKLSNLQAASLRLTLFDSVKDFGLPPLALCPWVMPAIGEADTPVIVEGDTAPPPADPTDLDAWDAETARLVAEREGRVGALEAAWEDLHAEASLAKKAFEAERDKMRAFIRERRDQRGRPYPKPEKTLFDGVGEHPADGDELPADLWQKYPLDFGRWERFGLTEKDCEKLNAGETKNHGTHPMTTLGDVTRFITPDPKNPAYARTLKDVRGFGDKGMERWTEAETRFWAWWQGGGLAEFAAEQGVTPDASADGPGSGDGGEGGEANAEAGADAATTPAAHAEQPPKRLRRNEKTGELEDVGEEAKPKRKRAKAA